jgi:3-isopropylmalate/(R)-2-methylmalate dehydratase small subunit
VISSAIADIFYNNALKNGLLPVVVDAESHAHMLVLFSENPQAELTIDLESQTVSLPDGEVLSFPIDSFAKACLLQGVDEMGYLLGLEGQIAAYEANG